MYKRYIINIIKVIHTLIWIFLSTYIVYILYAAIINKIDVVVYIGVFLVLLEGIILLIFKWNCPITILVKNISVNYEEYTDIYLPKWLAKNTKTIFSTIFIIAILIMAIRIIFKI